MTVQHRTLVDVLHDRVACAGDVTGYTFLDDGEHPGDRLTYAELDANARAIAAALCARGLRPGDRALLLYPPGLEFIPAFFGCLYAGVIAVPCYPPQAGQLSRTLPRLLGIIDDAQVSAVLSPAAIANGPGLTAQPAAPLRGVPWIATDALPLGADDWRRPVLDGGTLAFLQYTSGSTAAPRGVMVTHANLLHNLAYARSAGGNDETTVSVSWLPVIHDMGLIEGVLQPVYAGYPAYLMAPAAFLQRPIRWLRAITRFGATNSGGPNFAYDLCARKISDAQCDELDLRAWRVAYNGSEPIRSDTLVAFHERFRAAGFSWESFCPAYGLAEATLLVSTTGRGRTVIVQDGDADSLARGDLRAPTSTTSDRRRLVSSGPPAFDTRVVIVDPDTLAPCIDGRVGEIWVASPSVARGYWGRADETRETFGAYLTNGDGPFLRTGDLGAVYDGELFVTGRLKDLLIVRGMKHYPHDIELTGERQDIAIRAGCSAAFSSDAGDGEMVAIAMEIDTRQLPVDGVERAARLDEIIGAVRKAVAEHHGIVLSGVALLPLGAIPKTSSGKLRRRACRAAFHDGSLDELARWTPPLAKLRPTVVMSSAAPLLRMGT